MEAKNAEQIVIVGEKKDYSGLPHRGDGESQEQYKLRRKAEKYALKNKLKGKVIHLSKYVHEDKSKHDDDKKHYFIDGKGAYRKPVESDKKKV